MRNLPLAHMLKYLILAGGLAVAVSFVFYEPSDWRDLPAGAFALLVLIGLGVLAFLALIVFNTFIKGK